MGFLWAREAARLEAMAAFRWVVVFEMSKTFYSQRAAAGRLTPRIKFEAGGTRRSVRASRLWEPAAGTTSTPLWPHRITLVEQWTLHRRAVSEARLQASEALKILGPTPSNQPDSRGPCPLSAWGLHANDLFGLGV